MFIHDAIAATDAKAPFVTRKAWHHKYPADYRKASGTHPRVILSDAPGGCRILHPLDGSAAPWVPSKADLVADDWEACWG